jgi:hypothetical protein
MNLTDRQDTDYLKFIGKLPPQDNYISVESFNQGAWYWVDKNTPCLQIVSPDPHPWGQEWVILLVVDRGIKDLVELPPLSVSLKLSPLPPVIGDGEAETGPLATAWHSNKFINPIRDGAVLPILHLNGYKIANPTILARISHEELEDLFKGYGYTPYFVEGHDPAQIHQLMAATLETVILEIKKIQTEARTSGVAKRPRWPMIVLRTPKGWTAPPEIDGYKLEGFWRSHQVAGNQQK